MNFLDYITSYKERHTKGGRPLSISIVTNFTDDILERVFGGVCVAEGIEPTIVRAPYKQYHFVLRDPKSELLQSQPDITYFFFDSNPFVYSELSDSEDFLDELIEQIRSYADSIQGTIVVTTMILPTSSVYGIAFAEDPLYRRIKAFNEKVLSLTAEYAQVHVFDSNKLVQIYGEKNIRDWRGLYAFDMPFTNDFCVTLSKEWFQYIRPLVGRVTKCIVLDLDNTLWGGVVGETGSKGIAIGPTYPGVAFQNFQRVLLQLRARGVLLAIASKNNMEDVQEVFDQNEYMILAKDDFSALRINWDEKSKNIESIAKELNIGLNSILFIDDNPLERERMRQALPEVMVPEISFEPEYIVRDFLSVPYLAPMTATTEDLQKATMYKEEALRTEAKKEYASPEAYIRSLAIALEIRQNDYNTFERVAQLTQKTNQFNLMTKRYTRSDIERFVQGHNAVFSGNVVDKFGRYGIVIVGIFTFEDTTAQLDTLLMSCRAFGRDVEYVFLKECLKECARKGATTIKASFTKTTKNAPAEHFLETFGFTLKRSKGDTKQYVLDIAIESLNQKENKEPLMKITVVTPQS